MRPHPDILVATILGLLACQGDTPTSGSGPTVPLAGTPLTLIRFRPDSFAYAFHSGLREPENLVIRDAAVWIQLWQEIHASVTPSPPLPSVDFDQEMIVASALGTRNTGGYNILLTEATEDSGLVQIKVLETSPGSDCVTTQALTQPVDLARVARREGPVRFLAIQRVERCGI